jgi:hypothetical protein
MTITDRHPSSTELGTTSVTLPTAVIDIAYQVCWLGLTEAQAPACS